MKEGFCGAIPRVRSDTATFGTKGSLCTNIDPGYVDYCPAHKSAKPISLGETRVFFYFMMLEPIGLKPPTHLDACFSQTLLKLW